MTYTKISLPETNRTPFFSSHDTPIHKPEIHITNKSNDYEGAYTASRSFLPSASTFFAVLALCLASFIIGCCSTDTELCNTVICINTVASGRLPYTTFQEVNSISEQSNTVYRKYMTGEDYSGIPAEADSSDIAFLAANPEMPDIENYTHSQVSGDSDSIIEASENSIAEKAGSDGEILYPVISRNLACSDIHSLSNQTSYKPDTYSLMETKPAVFENLSVDAEKPLVLIVHTHGTECYNHCETDGYYSYNGEVRSYDITKNVVSMGAKIASVLENFGIPSVHSTKMYDKDSFVKAYNTSYAEVKQYLSEHPSIKFVIDLHRDSIEDTNHTKTKPVVEIAGENTAQLMFVVGTNASGNKHPNWKNNLSLALNLQNEISKLYPGLFRRINLRTASFNQQLSDGYLLLECGSCANSYEEAENAAEMFATGLAKVIKQNAS